MGLFSSKPIGPTESDVVMSRLVQQIIELCRPEWTKEKDEELIEECAMKARDIILDAFMMDPQKYYLSYGRKHLLEKAMGERFRESGLSIYEFLKKDWMTSVW